MRLIDVIEPDLLRHEVVEGVARTPADGCSCGSTATGKRVLDGQKSNFKRVALELGGKGATVVFADADLDEAVEGVVFGAFLNAGEECGSTPRLIVHADVADEMVERVVVPPYS